jgi:hypothetical protein
MIENTLLHSILDTIYKQIEGPWWVPHDDNQFDPLHGLLKIRKWGSLQKDKIARSIYCQEHAVEDYDVDET